MKKTLIISGLFVATVAALCALQIKLDKDIHNEATKDLVTKYEAQLKDISESNQEAMRRMAAELDEYDTIIHELHESYSDKLLAAAIEAGPNYRVATFGATAYSPYDDINGINSDGNPSVTSVGLEPGPAVFAVDPSVIPYYATMIIIYRDGTVITGIAGDCGGAIVGNRVDIYRDTYEQALEHGYQEVTVIWF